MKKEMPRKPRPQKRGRTLESAERSPVPARRAVTAQRQRRCPEWITRRWARAPARAWPPRRQPNRPAKIVTPPTADQAIRQVRSEEHTSELQSLMRISYAVFCLKKKN